MFAEIDELNAADPETLTSDGLSRPRALLQAEMATAWVRRLSPDAQDAQLVAARGHHLQRWSTPRSDHPPGRAGYLRWRAAATRASADRVVALLLGHGWEQAAAERVGAIIRKEGLRRDPVVQTHEDALCLVFLETQLGAVGDRLGGDATVAVLVKTLNKMSRTARDLAADLDLAPAASELLAAALRDVYSESPSRAEVDTET